MTQKIESYISHCCLYIVFAADERVITIATITQIFVLKQTAVQRYVTLNAHGSLFYVLQQ